MSKKHTYFAYAQFFNKSSNVPMAHAYQTINALDADEAIEKLQAEFDQMTQPGCVNVITNFSRVE